MPKLDYEEFKEYCMKNIVTIFGKNKYEASFKPVQKNDEIIFDSIQLKETGMESGMIPSFRTRPFYDDYCKGAPLGEVMLGIVKLIESAAGVTSGVDVESLTVFDKIKDKLIIRPISYTKNKKILNGHIYSRHGDIALVLYSLMKHEPKNMMTAKIPKATAMDWNLGADYLLRTAMENTMRLFPPFIVPLEQTFQGEENVSHIPNKNKFFLNPLMAFELLPSMLNAYFLSIENGVNGAVAAFYPGVPKRLSGIFQDDLYFVFLSVREAVVHPASTVTAADMKEAASHTENNPYVPDAAEYLSTRAYLYTRESGELKEVPA